MNKINELEQLINRMISLEVSFNEVTPLIGKYLYNYNISEQELLKIYSYLSDCIAHFENEFDNDLSDEEKETFHYVMDCFKNSKVNLTPIELYLIERYDLACQKAEKTEGLSNAYVKRKLHPDYKPSIVEESLELSTYGLTLIPIIITATIIIGSVLAALLLVK